MAPIKHIIKRVANRVSISLSSFLSSVLLLEGTFIEFIITCNVNSNVSKTHEQLKHAPKRKLNINKNCFEPKLFHIYKGTQTNRTASISVNSNQLVRNWSGVKLVVIYIRCVWFVLWLSNQDMYCKSKYLFLES